MTPKKYMINEGEASRQEIHLYQQKMRSILYVSTIIWPDVACTASKLSEFLQNPFPRHLAAADQAIAYLYATKTLALEFSADVPEEQVFTCASNAAFGDDVPTRRSSEGFLFQLFGGPIDWHATKQKTVTTSSTEAELLTLTHAMKKIY